MIQDNKTTWSAVHPVHSPLVCSRHKRHTTAMDGGSADIAGANICQYILYIRRSFASLRPRRTLHPVDNKKAAIRPL